MTATLAVKLLLTPALVALATFVARRWGAQVGGWLVGFPFTSAPVAVILVLDYGRGFAATAAVAILLGVLSQAVFAIVYAWAALRVGWPYCLGGATLAFAACTAALTHVNLAPLAAAFIVAAGLTLVLALAPKPGPPVNGVRSPAWDLPARMLIATTFVLTLTALAARLGPMLTGLLSPFPLYATVLGVFTHLHDGSVSAAAVMRGLLMGLYGFGAFFLALALLLVPAGSIVAFACAIVGVAAAQAAALAFAARSRA